MHRLLPLLVIAPCAFATGCANYASLQEAETMRARAFELGVGGTATRYALELETTQTVTDATGATTETTETEREDLLVPALTLWGRYGVTDRLELHAIAWLPLGASVGAKYMLVGDRDKGGFMFSPGLDLSAPITFQILDTSGTLFDAYVPLNMGYRFDEAAEVYFTPKYVLRMLASSDAARVGHAAGATVGFALGHKTQLLVEGSLLYDTLFDAPIVGGAIGVGFE
ncbi:MAG: hypothetical protein OEZ06_16085 [Myxococcales bacterium]|nr:hypothetical protein [Myxococcales bacterium]